MQRKDASDRKESSKKTLAIYTREAAKRTLAKDRKEKIDTNEDKREKIDTNG